MRGLLLRHDSIVGLMDDANRYCVRFFDISREWERATLRARVLWFQ